MRIPSVYETGLPKVRLGQEAGKGPLLLFGDGAIREAHDLVGSLLIAGEKAVVADGANRFDAYRLAELARQQCAAHAAGPTPREVLSRVRVSRAFSWQQWLVLLGEKAGAEASRSGARAVFVLGPLDLLTDNDLKEADVRAAARKVADALTGLARSGLRVVAAQKERRLVESKRGFLLDPLRQSCRVVVTEGDKVSCVRFQVSVPEKDGSGGLLPFTET
jgi:hypothetical protein